MVGGRRARRAGAALAALALLAACGGGDGGGAAASDAADDRQARDDTLRYVMHEVRREEGCRPASPADSATGDVAPCVTVELSFPDSLDGATPALRAAVTAFLAQAVLTAPFDSLPAASPEALAESFVRAYESAYRETPAEWQRWFLEQGAEVACNDGRVLGLRGAGSQHTGGAHPISWARLASYDARTGRLLDVDALVVPESLPALTAAAERAFREAREIAPEQSLTDAGFTELEGGRFRLPRGLLLCPDSVSFHFDAYEIAPYAVGPSSFALPAATVRPFLRADAPLVR